MHIALFFGSFNPVHIGHLIIARHVAQHCALNKVWLVVSPHNPFKESKTLLNEYDRLHLAKLAVEDDDLLQVSDIEFKLPRPSFTIDTLAYLKEHFPKYTFSILLGSDGCQNILKWKNAEKLLAEHDLIVYERPGFPVPEVPGARMQTVKAPMLDISATFIRNEIRAEKSIRYLVPEKVAEYIEDNRYYR